MERFILQPMAQENGPVTEPPLDRFEKWVLLWPPGSVRTRSHADRSNGARDQLLTCRHIQTPTCNSWVLLSDDRCR